MSWGLQNKPWKKTLNKIQFTQNVFAHAQNVFEVAHAHQTQEMHSVVAGISDEYVLADNAGYLQVPADMWFE